MKKHIRLNENIFTDDIFDNVSNLNIDISDQIYGINISDYTDVYDKFKSFYYQEGDDYEDYLQWEEEIEEYENIIIFDYNNFKELEQDTNIYINKIFKTDIRFKNFVNDCIKFYGKYLNKYDYQLKYANDWERIQIYNKCDLKSNSDALKKYNITIEDNIYNLLFNKGFIWFACQYGLE